MGQRPLIVRNLGNRSFSLPRYATVLQESGDIQATENILVELEGAGDFHLFGNIIAYQPDGSPLFTPSIIPAEGTGKFALRTELATQRSTPWYPIDLDGDHQVEFIELSAGRNGTTIVSIYDRQPDGSYIPTSQEFPGQFAGDVIHQAIDLDGDTQLDLAIGSYPLRILRRTGPRSFAPTSITIENTSNHKFADLDGDGLPDIYELGSTWGSWTKNLGNMAFAPTENLSGFPEFLEGSEVFDIKEQTGANAIIRYSIGETNTLSLREVRFRTWETISEKTIPTLTLNPLPPVAQSYRPYAPRKTCFPIAEVDLDNDGHLDFLFVAINQIPTSSTTQYQLTHTPELYRLAIAWGTPAGYDRSVYVHPAPISNRDLIVADFDSQTGPDIITGPDVGGKFWFFANSGSGTFSAPLRVEALDIPAICPPGTVVSSVLHGDVTGDHIVDLVISYRRTANGMAQTATAVAAGLGDGTFSSPQFPEGSFSTVSFVVADAEQLFDWDQDGDLDIMTNGGWRENIGGQFSTEFRPLIDGAVVTDILGNPDFKIHSRVGDVDGDGHPDIISLIYRIEEPESPFIGGLFLEPKAVAAIGFNDGNGGIEEITEIPVNLLATDLLGNPVIYDLQIADVNGDGRTDLCYNQFATVDLLGNPLSQSKWRRNPGGAAARNPSLWTTLPFGSSELPKTLNPEEDFNGDGVLEWAHSSGYIRPTPTGPAISAVYDFTKGTIPYYNNFNQYIADFDGDGDLDTLHTDGAFEMLLVRNTIIDERSPITRYLVAAGSTGKLAQPHADADGDGIDNQTELILGTNPLVADASPSNPLGVQLDATSGSSSLSFRLPAYATELGIDYEIERSTDLIEWHPVGQTSGNSIMSANGWNYRNLPLECSGPCGYFRIRGTHRPPEN